jgi:DNA-binding transcriptional regulator PaaX
MGEMKKQLRYKGVPVGIFGLPILNKKSEKVHKNQKCWSQYKVFNIVYEKTAPKNLIVMYDIPHEKKKEREWFRRQLKKFNYVMIQKSVWVGPSPLPKDFIAYVKSIGLIGQLKTFKLAKSYTGEESVFN